MRQYAFPLAAIAFAIVPLIASADVSDDLPVSVVMWVCPDEPFAGGIGKPRYYRKSFETTEGLVKASARWWVDDIGEVFVDGEKMPYSAMMVDNSADLTAILKKPGRHVMAIEGTNLAAAGGVCVSIDLEYAGGRHESVYTDGSWKYASTEVSVTYANGRAGRATPPDGWTTVGFDDSAWKSVKVYGDLFSAPWTSVADMTQMELYGERRRRAEVVAAREARAAKALAALEREKKPVCKVAYDSGKSYFDIGGKLFETTYYNCNENWNGGNRGLRRQVAAFRDAGMHVYGIGVSTPSVWRPDGSIDFADAERKMRDVLSIDPDARFQFCIATSFPPKWWMDRHPDELVAYANAEVNPTEWDHIKNYRAPSFASKLWRRDMCDYLTRLVKHIESTPYAKRIFAYRPDFGVYHEWHYYGMAECMPDVGKAMATAFGRPFPSKAERLRTSAGATRDPVKDRAAIEFARFMGQEVRDCLLEFDKAVKDACGGRALVGNYYGYFFGMPFRAEGWHLETDAVLDSPYVDFLCSPNDYSVYARGGGNLEYSRCILESYRRRGKLAVLEADTRTTLHKNVGDNLHSKSRSDDIALLARDFAGPLCWGCGFWYYDFGYGWYDAPEFTELFKKIYPIRREIKDCRSIAEVLVVGDFESVLYTNADSAMYCFERTSGLVYALGHTGVPFDSADVADVASGKLKDYKLYIFCNLHHTTPEKERLVADLRAKGRTVLLPEKPMTTAQLRALFAKEGIHIWNDDADSAVYASASCVALHSATGGEKTIRLPRRAKVTMLYPERKVISEDTDRIVFTPDGKGMSTTIFRHQDLPEKGTLRILPVGDSITHGSQSSTGNGYRSPLWCALAELGYKVDFVGTQTDSYGRFDARLGDPDHEGISGITIKGMLGRIDSVFDKCGQVDCVLLHIGTNESLLGRDEFVNEATNRLVRLLDRIYERCPGASVVATTLLPRRTGEKGNWKYEDIVKVFNPAVPQIVERQRAKGQKVYFVDMHSVVGFKDLADGLHPNDAGYKKMARAWLDAVTSIFPRPASEKRP